MTEKRFTVDSDGKYWDKINHKYVNLDYLFKLVEELDDKIESKQHTINEMVKIIRIYDDGYIDLNKNGTEEKCCGHCKHYQLDGMFGIWCDIYEYPSHDAKNCPNYER